MVERKPEAPEVGYGIDYLCNPHVLIALHVSTSPSRHIYCVCVVRSLALTIDE